MTIVEGATVLGGFMAVLTYVWRALRAQREDIEEKLGKKVDSTNCKLLSKSFELAIQEMKHTIEKAEEKRDDAREEIQQFREAVLGRLATIEAKIDRRNGDNK